ncbi:MAG: phosphoribosylformylglycinamidine synthase [Lachnospiraceae bacterium]|nr:phosphoribosylformylglycinamidine synthase [Lachnospiraceae bacterium]
MSKVRRIYVEKKPAYAVKAKELYDELTEYLNLKIDQVRVLIRYDIESVSASTYEKALQTVFAEPPVDYVYETTFPREEAEKVFSVEALPGQFDQRADSAEQCVKLLNEKEDAVIRCATTYVITGDLTENDMDRIKSYCINPVDSRETDDEVIPATLIQQFAEPAEVEILDGFKDMEQQPLRELYDSLGLAMTFKDFLHIQNYFGKEEKRDPSMTEIRVLDTYWSDHCRHTTFATELTNVTFQEGYYRKPIEESYQQYLSDREELYGSQNDKYVCLMDIALMAMKKLRAEGKLTEMEVSDEINACSIEVPVEIDGEQVRYLIQFKNETHNHPTEIEPFGGAATCLGGCIRDPLSGRSYVYQAMSVTGAADPTRPLSETLEGKLPQRKLVTTAAHGYSSYGNQIGLATGLVSEIYHPNYLAKRMEIGAVVAAAPKKNVKRLTSDPGNVIILIGGRTGRDGIGGATGSSKKHTTKSIDTCGSEVQKGNPPTERKIQRLFRREEVASIIRKCNDFGAGGVSVAIGELADGLRIDLDKVPKKYAGLDGTEIAISESQERMAVVVDRENVEQMLRYCEEENLEAVVVAEVTVEKRLVMSWRGKEIVNIARSFIDTNGAHQESDVTVTMPKEDVDYLNSRVDFSNVKERWLDVLGDLNVCSQKGLVEMFDSSIGAGTVVMPYGGKYQLTPAQAMAAKLPLSGGKCNTVTLMSYGMDPYLLSWSPYHGAVYSVVHSVARIVASGGDWRNIYFTFQEYFKRLGDDPTRWGEPMAALLGAYAAQMGFGLASIGGKDSMSGSFNDIDVPPTLCSFAVDVAKTTDIVTPEFKAAGNVIVKVDVKRDAYGLPDYEDLKQSYTALYEDIQAGRIEAAYAIGYGGMVEAVSKMGFGNKIGAVIEESVVPDTMLEKAYGSILCEVREEMAGSLTVRATQVGHTTAEQTFCYGDVCITMEDALQAWTNTLEKVFPTSSHVRQEAVPDKVYDTKEVYVCRHKVAVPKVFIPVFPGTNCEYDSARAFERAGASVESLVFKNMTEQNILDSVDAFAGAIRQSQIIMFPGGFSAGDEPEGSAKFFATAFRNAKLKEEIQKLLEERDGLVLGICNGFQALIKLGLVPYGTITAQKEDSPTLTMNSIGRHQSKMVYTKVVTNKSPWLSKAVLGGVYTVPISHGEGRFVADQEWIDRLFANGQVATQYVDLEGKPTMEEDYNVNGSYAAIEGITSPDGRILGKMAHSERRDDAVAINIYGDQNQLIFESGVEYFK